jgi:hypothetical protein
MGITLPAFTPIQESLFLTLCGRALDYRSPHPILADTMADEIVRKLDYDCDKFRLSASPIINIALRTKKLDEVALTLVARHPDAVALDLGAGLDTRMFRVAPPSTVDWYDIALIIRDATRVAALSWKAAMLTSTFDPNLDPNRPQQRPTQADTPRRGAPRNPRLSGHSPTSTGTRTPSSLLRAESGLRDGPDLTSIDLESFHRTPILDALYCRTQSKAL